MRTPDVPTFEGRHLAHPDEPVFDQGLAFDLDTMVTRGRLIRLAEYSLYTVPDQNYLRGVQEARSDGVVTFTSIFPGCYSGRWPHIHFEVFPSLDAATDDANTIATSQIALREDACAAVYAVAGYEQSLTNLQQTSLETDMVFGDTGGDSQLGTVTGSVDTGYVVELAVPVAA